MPVKSSVIVLIATMFALLLLVLLGISHYENNVSGLLHMDVPFGERHQVPEGLVLYTDAAYDGMLYYQVTRDLPELFTGGKTSFDSPYRFQRILLPILTYVTTLGNEPAFPMAMLILNLIASLGALMMMLKMTKGKKLHALTVICNPAILVGILYMLTEPMSILFIVLFWYVWQKDNQRLTFLSLGALILSLFARETTVFLIGLLILWSIWNRRWKEAALFIIPIILFIAWQYFLVVRFGAVGFQANGNIVSFPFVGPISVITRLIEHLHSYLLSSLGLLLFVIPLCIAVGYEFMKKRTKMNLLCFVLAGLTFTMITMDTHMWGAITSIGRVVTPIYPIYALYAAERDTWVERTLSITLIVMSIVAAVGIALMPHPFIIS